MYLHYRTPTLPGTIRVDHKTSSSWVLNGAHRVPLAGLALVPGLYLVRLHVGTQSQTVKLVVE